MPQTIFTTNFPTPLSSTCNLLLGDQNGYAIQASGTGAAPSTANTFQHGCLYYRTDSGTGTPAVYQNIGSIAVPSWSLVDTSSASLVLPTAATDSTSTTGKSLDLTFSTLTTGVGYNGLVTTANFTTGGAVYKADMAAAVAGNGFVAVTTGAYTGTGLSLITANSATTGTLRAVSGTGLTTGSCDVLTGGGANMTSSGQVQLITMGAATTGQGQQITTTGVYTGLNGIRQATANSATTGTIDRVNGTGLTSGNVQYLVGGGANMTTGGNVANHDMGAATAGSAHLAQTSGVYIGTDGVRRLTANSATSGVLDVISATGLTTGIAKQVKVTAATLTTGRYVSYNDTTTGEVFGIGTNGHIISTVSASAPTIAVTQQNGITAAAITAGGSDTAGIITTTGTNNNGGTSILQVTFGKTYTTAPKAVILTPRNAAAAKVAATSLAGVYVSATAATTFDITIPQDASAGATPSWNYVVIA